MASSLVTLTLLTTLITLTTALPQTTTTPVPTSTPSPTPNPYPVYLNSTSKTHAFRLEIKSNNPSTDGHNIQLISRPDQSKGPIVGVDPYSPVLAARLESSILYATSRDEFNQISDTGLIGGLELMPNSDTASNNTEIYSFIFSPPETIDDASKLYDTQRMWNMLEIGDAGTYGLYQYSKSGYSMGFHICEVQDEGYYELYYAEASDGGIVIPKDCESVGLQTVLGVPIDE